MDASYPRRQGDRVRRRAFITLLGGAAVAWPLAARAQQRTMPVIGFLHAASPDTNTDRLRAFRQGLKESGFIDGENVAVEYRWGENQIDRLPALVTELIRRQVAVIVATGGSVPALAAKAGTTTIPIVFTVPEDPVRLGLVASLARPGGNATGINFFSAELLAKRLELLRELVPAARHLAVLVNPADAEAETVLRDMDTATRAMGLQIQILNVSTSRDIDATFATFARERPDAVFVSGGPLFISRRVQLVLLATRHAVPASYGSREYAEIGGLMSYGTSLTDVYRQLGVYAGRILKGAKPADLPVMQATKFELVINAQAARVLGLTVPPMLLARADEVIE
jgi:putative tryptophan/tyrosine transport system substrate-binding protein